MRRCLSLHLLPAVGVIGGVLLLCYDLIGPSLFPWMQWGRLGSPTLVLCHRGSYSRSGNHRTGGETLFPCVLAVGTKAKPKMQDSITKWTGLGGIKCCGPSVIGHKYINLTKQNTLYIGLDLWLQLLLWFFSGMLSGLAPVF